MVVMVRLYSHLAQVFGVRALELQARDVASLLDALAERLGRGARARLSACSFLVNGERVDPARKPSRALEGGDVVDVLPPAAGG